MVKMNTTGGNKMKRLLALMLAAMAALSLTACGGSGNSPSIQNAADTSETEEKNWEFYEGTSIPTFDSAMDVPLYQTAGQYYMYDCGTSEDVTSEYMKIYAATVAALGNEEIDSPVGAGFAFDTPSGTLVIVGTNPTEDGHYIVLVYFE